MTSNNSVSNNVTQSINNLHNEIHENEAINNFENISSTNTNDNHPNINVENVESHFNANNNTITTSSSKSENTNNEIQQNQQPILINIVQIHPDINYSWKIQAVITCAYPQRTFTNTYGMGELSSWDLTDSSGSITMLAFNLNSNLMQNKLQKDKIYEFSNFTIRPASAAYKTLPHDYQLVCINATTVQEINASLNHIITYNFTHLSCINNIPLNTIIDIQVKVLRDFGISTGIKNEITWSRRDLHVEQDDIRVGLTLWNSQAEIIDRNMFGLKIKVKNVKVSWFDGTRILMSMGNTLLRTY